jgi:hypothetical protein
MIRPETNQNPGLCTTCNNEPTCFHHARRGPALFCEMFDDYVWPDRERSARVASPRPDPVWAAQATVEDGVRYSGLCMNCEHHRSCAHPKPAGGIWHCEDYE